MKLLRFDDEAVEELEVGTKRGDRISAPTS
jgi:hypothetical protein